MCILAEYIYWILLFIIFVIQLIICILLFWIFILLFKILILLFKILILLFIIVIGYLLFNSQLCSSGTSSEISFMFTSPTPPEGTSSVTGCLEFSFYMRGSSVGDLIIMHMNLWGSYKKIWRKYGNVGEKWFSESVRVSSLGSRLTLIADCGDAGSSDIAVDDIKLSTGNCPGK